MKHIIVAPTLNEYDVDEEFFVTYEAGMPRYVFTVLDEQHTPDGKCDTVKSQLAVPVAAVVEMHSDYNEEYIEAMRVSSDRVLKAQMEQMQQNPTEPTMEGVEDHERRDYI